MTGSLARDVRVEERNELLDQALHRLLGGPVVRAHHEAHQRGIAAIAEGDILELVLIGGELISDHPASTVVPVIHDLALIARSDEQSVDAPSFRIPGHGDVPTLENAPTRAG